ncbi:MAG: protein kinase [Gemmatimonadota bacterium]|nr:protein kinase [Gemmatimonadota bacterium]
MRARLRFLHVPSGATWHHPTGRLPRLALRLIRARAHDIVGVSEPPEPFASLSAALADRYRLESPLGEGGMATVFLAQDLRHDRQVAVKVLKPELAEALGAQRFLKEIRVTASLQHPHILPLYDSGNANGVLFYVMPLVRGESLRERLSRGAAFTIQDTTRLIGQVAGALDFAHRQGIIHRDIKPENILLQDGEALLADFGIALAVIGSAESRMTRTGLSIGTIQYMSPEQAAGQRDLDARSDIYSLGAVAYEMLAGAPPLTAATPRAMIAKLMTESPVSLRTVRRDVPVSVDDAVLRALAKEPADRFASARDFGDALAASSSSGSGDVEFHRAQGALGRRGRRLIALASIVVVIMGGFVFMRGKIAARSAPIVAHAPIRSLAILPLANHSGDSTQDYFAEGMTDELTAAIATISALRVTSRGSAMQFHGAARPSTLVIGKALNVDAIVEGSVARLGDKVRITAELIDARADTNIWTRSFERKSSDVLALQADLATAIAREINVRLTATEQSRLASAPTVNAEGHDAYLVGRFFFNRPSDENLRKAIAQFEKSVALNPGFAAGYSGLSDAYLWAGYNEGFLTAAEGKIKSKAAAERAVQLDSNSAEAHTSLATYMLFYERDWLASEREFRRAIALNPSYAFAHDQFGMALGFTGRFDESIAEGKRAAELDPLSPQVLIDATMPFLFRRDAAGARALTKRAAELDPTYFFPVMSEGWILIEAGNVRQAIPFLRKAITMGAPPFVTAYLAYALAAAGDRAAALQQLEALKAMAPGRKVLPFNLALVYLGLGDKARAVDNLERAYDADSQLLAWVGQDAMFDPLRSEPRFIALMRKLHFMK